MVQRLIFFKNESEFLSVSNVLDKNAIPYQSIQGVDSSFPTLNGENLNYQLIIDETHSANFFRLIPDDYPNKIVGVSEPAKQRKIKRWLFIMIGLSVVLAGLFLKYFNIYQELQYQKCYDISWNSTNTRVTNKHKSLKLKNVFLDDNFDLNYEGIHVHVKGSVVIKTFDRDENGIAEEILYFNLDGMETGRSLDKNQDGIHDDYTVKLANKNQYHFIDSDSDGDFDTVEVE